METFLTISNLSEDDLQELSSQTLRSYQSKAAKDITARESELKKKLPPHKQKFRVATSNKSDYAPSVHKEYDKMRKRRAGLAAAATLASKKEKLSEGEQRRQPQEQDDSQSLRKFEEFRKRQAAKKAAKQQAVKEEINPNAAAAHARIDQKKIKIAMQAAKAAMAQKAKPNK